MHDFIEPLGHGIFAIDTGFQRARFDAAYLMVEANRAAFIDTGTNHAVPRLLAALASLEIDVAAVDWVIPTHVHLDHAGGAGLLMQSLPNARMLVHPRGVRHMIDPSALYQGALAVYGEAEMQRSYGELQAVPAERVQSSFDGEIIHLADRPLQLIDSPGHARHHHCIWDARSLAWFTGDSFGLSYREFDTAAGPWLLPTSTPVQFDPVALRETVRRLLSYAPRGMYLTHYGRIGHSADEVQALAKLLLDEVDEMVALALPLRAAPERHPALKAALLGQYQRRLQAHGWPGVQPGAEGSGNAVAEMLAVDIELNAQGLAVWLDKPAT